MFMCLDHSIVKLLGVSIERHTYVMLVDIIYKELIKDRPNED